MNNQDVENSDSIATPSDGSDQTVSQVAEAETAHQQVVEMQSTSPDFPQPEVQDEAEVSLDAFDTDSFDIDFAELEALKTEVLEAELAALEALESDALEAEQVEPEAVEAAAEPEVLETESVELEAADAVEVASVEAEPTRDDENVQLESIDSDKVETPTPVAEQVVTEQVVAEADEAQAVDREALTAETETIERPTAEIVETTQAETATVEATENQVLTNESPTTETPAIETPAPQAETVKAPTIEAPTIEAPATEAPAAEAPTAIAEASKTEALEKEAPKPQASGSQPTFENFNLLPAIQEAVRAEGYTKPTQIQAQAIPIILDGRDLIGQANTGTGKTAAFALPLLCRVMPQVNSPQVVVLAPTRELAIQVADAFETYAQNLPQIRIATIYGGQSYGIQIGQLKRGAHIVVGTPGRVIDHLKRGNLKLDHLHSFVLDEADEMLNMGFADDVSWILSESPAERQTLMFSATVPAKLRRIAEAHLSNPVNLALTTKTLTTSTVHQRACLVTPREKLRLLSRILESETTDGVIVFVKTKEMSSRLAENLCQRGFQASALNGDMAQQQRERTVERLKSGQLNILVATDVAARGLDVDRITHVINYDYPTETEAYVHRIGRTGRAGREGHAILFVGPRERNQTKHLEKVTGQKVTWMLQPTNEEIRTQRGIALQKSLKTELEKAELEDFEAIVQQFVGDNPEVNMGQVAAALARMIMQRRDVESDARDGARNDRDRRDRRGRGERGGRRDSDNRRSFGDDRRGRDGSPRGRHGERSDRRGAFGDRGEGRGNGERRSRDRGTEAGKVKYRIEVGYSHGVKPGNIVGALTSESGLRGSDIGGIDINTHFSTVDLPEGLPQEMLQGIGQLRIAGQPLKIREWKIRGGGGHGKFDEKPRSFSRRKNGKPSWKKPRKKSAK